MPVSYEGNDTYPSSITLPVDGDKIKAESVASPLRALADRSKNLVTRVQSLESGVKRVQEVDEAADLNDLSAENGELVYVPGLGLFRFDASSTLEHNGVTVIQPGSRPSGRWIAIDYYNRSNRRTVFVDDDDYTVNPLHDDLVLVKVNDDRTCTLPISARVGDTVKIALTTGSTDGKTLTIERADNLLLWILKFEAGQDHSVELLYTGSSWVMVSRTTMPGRVRKRVIDGATSGTTTYSINDADVIIAPDISSNNVNYQISRTGAANGDTMTILLSKMGSDGQLNVHIQLKGSETFTTVATLKSWTVDDMNSVTLVYHDGRWHVMSTGVRTTV